MSREEQAVVLIVEDSRVQAEMLRRGIEEAGYRVNIARHGASALEMAHAVQPQIIVSDVNMPKMDGYTLCAKVRADEQLATIPVILVTTLGDTSDIMHGLEVGADAYLTKPYSMEVMLSWIGMLLRQAPVQAHDRRKSEAWINGELRPVEANPQRMLNLMISTYQSAVVQNRELQSLQVKLEDLNANLEQRVEYETKALAASESRWRALIEHASDAVLILDARGVIKFASPSMEHITDMSQSAILGRLFVDGAHQKDRAAIASALTAVCDEPDRMHAIEGRWRFSDGPWKDIEASLRNALGDPAVEGIVVNLRDITPRKQAEAHIRKLSSAIEQSPESIVITDLGGSIEYVNSAFETTTGYSRQEALGANPRILKSGKTPSGTYVDMWAQLTRGLVWSGIFHNRRKDGSDFLGEVIVAPIRGDDGTITHYLAIQEDITERRAMELELEEHRRDLESKVQRRTAQLAAATRRAEDANQAKSAFLSNMSHEIRTPMNAIIGLTYLLRTTATDPEQKSKLDRIAASGGHLMSVINTVLDISKIEAGKFTLDDDILDLHAAVESVLAMVTDAAAEKGIQLNCELGNAPKFVIGDKTRISQCLLNLLGNAIKFTAVGSVTVSLSVPDESDEDALVRFDVIDSGIGIPADALARLFTSFQQVDRSIDLKNVGTGLGLAITRGLAECMGGETGVESQLLAGSRFWFSARLRKCGDESSVDAKHTVTSEGTASDETKFAGTRVLLVDDNPVNLEVTGAILERVGISVTTAQDGLEAIEKLRNSQDSPYAMVLMDMEMPRMGGIEATLRIRELPVGSTIPIVAMTANAFGEDRKECLAAGMNDFLAKPVAPPVFFAMLRKWMRGRHQASDSVVATKPPMPPPPPPVAKPAQGLDLRRLDEMTNGETGIMAKVLQQFISHHANDLDLLEHSLSTGDFQRAFQIAHAIKGSAGQIGASDLHTRASAIEVPLRAGTMAAPADLENFSVAFASALEQARDWLHDNLPPTSSNVAGPPPDPTELLAKLKQLQLLLDATDGHALAAAEELAAELPPAYGESFAPVLDLIRRFELEGAARNMKLILPELEAELS